MNHLNKTALGAALATAFISLPAVAHEAGDFIVRLGGAYVVPDDSADCFNGATAAALRPLRHPPGLSHDLGPRLDVGGRRSEPGSFLMKDPRQVPRRTRFRTTPHPPARQILQKRSDFRPRRRCLEVIVPGSPEAASCF